MAVLALKSFFTFKYTSHCLAFDIKKFQSVFKKFYKDEREIVHLIVCEIVPLIRHCADAPLGAPRNTQSTPPYTHQWTIGHPFWHTHTHTHSGTQAPVGRERQRVRAHIPNIAEWVHFLQVKEFFCRLHNRANIFDVLCANVPRKLETRDTWRKFSVLDGLKWQSHLKQKHYG